MTFIKTKELGTIMRRIHEIKLVLGKASTIRMRTWESFFLVWGLVWLIIS
jgi:hypothetical protein